MMDGSYGDAMEAQYRTRSGRLVFKLQGETVKDIFRAIGQVQEVFDGDAACGACGSAQILFRTRAVDDNEYFELHCHDCYARLAFGQHKKGGTLFAKRKDENGNLIGSNGWAKYEKPNGAR